MERLFVYGTLAPGRPNEHVLAVVPGEWEPATVAGRLVDRGWGSALGYPAIVLADEGHDRVDGLVLSSPCLADHWERLDEFEGEGYERVPTAVRMRDGSVEEAWIYVGAPRSRVAERLGDATQAAMTLTPAMSAPATR